METIGGIILGLFVLVILVVLHELGHALAAMKSGVVVEEFGIGFPPKAWSKRLKNKVLLSVNWLPLGGFVKLQGENDSASGKGDYGAATYWSKTKILFAGVAMNWLTAIAIFTVLAATGMPRILDNQFVVPVDSRVAAGNVGIVSTVDGHPAQKANLAAGDLLLSVNGEDINSAQQFVSLTKSLKGQEISLKWQHNGETKTSIVQLRSEGESGYFGASLGQSEKLYSTWSAPLVGLGLTAQLSYETLKGLGGLLSNLFTGLIDQISFNSSTRANGAEKINSLGDNMAGPVGILGVIFPQASQGGITQVLMLTGVISLTLAVMNVLPIPALDGGRWFVTTYYKIRKKKLTKEREEKIHGTGFMFLMILIVIITIGDVAKIFK
jgi:regulator of sigma E protease